VTNLADCRNDFPILDTKMNGHPLIYLDSAATTQKPVQVLDAMDDYYRTANANVHRGAYAIAEEATQRYEAARAKIAAFINAGAPAEVTYQRGTTTGINTVAYGWGLYRLTEGDSIVLTGMEHHANIVPWQLIAKHTGAKLRYLPMADNFTVDTTDIDAVIDETTKIAAVSLMSNVLGTIGPVQQVAEAAHAVGAIVVADGAQAVPHLPTDVQTLGCDFLAFGAHKMLGPTGVGVLWGRPELLEEMEPAEGGGEMIRDVKLYESRWAPVPNKFEAGTPPIAEAIGFGAAVDYLSAIGMDTVRDHEIEITGYALEQLAAIPDMKIYGPTDVKLRGGAVSFELADIHPHDLATILDQRGIAIRAGHHCAKPLMETLGVPATARASFYIHNDRSDVDTLVEALHYAREVFGVG
jgi:cysteine desulfurase/selenocysteine lyase